MLISTGVSNTPYNRVAVHHKGQTIHNRDKWWSSGMVQIWVTWPDQLRLLKKGTLPDSKVHGVNVGPIWGRQDPDGPHVGSMNFAILDIILKVVQLKIYDKVLSKFCNTQSPLWVMKTCIQLSYKHSTPFGFTMIEFFWLTGYLKEAVRWYGIITFCFQI